MSTPIKFAPAIPLPVKFDMQARVRQLRTFLDPSDPWYQPEAQHVNIRKVIELYLDGTIDGSEKIYVSEGRVITKEAFQRRTTWGVSEVR